MNDWIWVTRDNVQYAVKEMPRRHVQNSLQWCIRNRTESQWLSTPESDELYEWKATKDGHSYDDWILAFTVRLLDPECE